LRMPFKRSVRNDLVPVENVIVLMWTPKNGVIVNSYGFFNIKLNGDSLVFQVWRLNRRSQFFRRTCPSICGRNGYFTNELAEVLI
jgi:hypothetical protein